eukprot:3044991-Prymnesium_polylepis.1
MCNCRFLEGAAVSRSVHPLDRGRCSAHNRPLTAGMTGLDLPDGVGDGGGNYITFNPLAPL